MVGGSVSPLDVQFIYEGKKCGGVVFVGAGFHAVDPGSPVGCIDIILNLLVKERKPEICGGLSAN